MVTPEVPNHLLFDFYREVTPMNAIKLLMRGKQLYETRTQAIKILKCVAEIEYTLKPG
jgi:hypothetical protein